MRMAYTMWLIYEKYSEYYTQTKTDKPYLPEAVLDREATLQETNGPFRVKYEHTQWAIDGNDCGGFYIILD